MIGNLNVNPTVVFVAIALLTIAAGIGEFVFNKVQPGLTYTLLGILLGGGIHSAGVQTGAKVAATIPPTQQVP